MGLQALVDPARPLQASARILLLEHLGMGGVDASAHVWLSKINGGISLELIGGLVNARSRARHGLLAWPNGQGVDEGVCAVVLCA